MSLRDEFENNPRPLVILLYYDHAEDSDCKNHSLQFGGKDACKRAIDFRDKTSSKQTNYSFALILNTAAEVEYEDMILAELDLEAFKVDGELDDDVDTELLGG